MKPSRSRIFRPAAASPLSTTPLPISSITTSSGLRAARRDTLQTPPYFKWFENDVILVLNRPAGVYRVEYSRAPYRIDPIKVIEGSDTLLNAELDNTPDTHPAIPYYVAAMIALDQNPKTYYALYNVWETRLSRMGYRPPHATAQPVMDMYGFDHFSGVW